MSWNDFESLLERRMDHFRKHNNFKIKESTFAFINCDNDLLARKIGFCATKKHLKNGYFCVQESELPDFGRTWTSNGWHQVNCLGGPENFGVEHFKLAMWKVGGTKF